MDMNQLHGELYCYLENEDMTVEDTLIKVKQLLDEYYDEVLNFE